MQFQATYNLNVRSGPGINSPVIKTITKGTVVVGDGASPWQSVTLQDGTKGYCAAVYLQAVPTPAPPFLWCAPVPQNYFVLSQAYLNVDWSLYPKFGHHTGVDYGGEGQTGIPIFASADGQIVYEDVATSAWGAVLGNHAALYVPSVNQSFLYCHMASAPHALGPVRSGDQIGVMGNTGDVAEGAIHLHLEGFHGQFQIAWRSFTSLADIQQKTFDADAFIRANLG